MTRILAQPLSRRTALTLAAGGSTAALLDLPATAAWANHPGQGMWVGANRIVHTPQGRVLNDWATWHRASLAHGPWTVRRTYSSDMASTIKGTLAEEMVRHGIHIHHSVKPPKGVTWRQAMDGRYDQALASLARSLPTRGATWLTVHHEPEGSVNGLVNDQEDKGTAADFVAFHQHCYRIVKRANRNVQVGPIHMSHQWQPGSATTARPQEWFVGDEYADFVGVDSYWTLQDGPAKGMPELPQFRRFYGWARKAYRRAPFGLLEFGYQYDPKRPLARAQAITATARFLTAEHFFTLQYWDSFGGRGWALDQKVPNDTLLPQPDGAAIKAYRAICANGRKR